MLEQQSVTEPVVPTLDHFTRFSCLQPGVVAHLQSLGVSVWAVSESCTTN
ncbi:hypothetical protein [Nocardiopsis ansamitocini]|nr:hypothetical protein [Nocardiopsis ansamitocini]